MKTFEVEVTRLRPLKWEWSIRTLDDRGHLICTISGTETWPSIAYSIAHKLRDRYTIDALDQPERERGEA